MLAPPYLLSHHFRMWMNSIPTGDRLSKMSSSATGVSVAEFKTQPLSVNGCVLNATVAPPYIALAHRHEFNF
jgi:hypothetical protein